MVVLYACCFEDGDSKDLRNICNRGNHTAYLPQEQTNDTLNRPKSLNCSIAIYNGFSIL
jgi:hypothetical protein